MQSEYRPQRSVGWFVTAVKCLALFGGDRLSQVAVALTFKKLSRCRITNLQYRVENPPFDLMQLTFRVFRLI